ncbi:MAG TPA: hypothetical protein IAD49_06605 [Candidatus Fimihabitans intestinipullorum]|uniref:Uncharacterized protein n=1 Tax=Candidatus Fimihabitans intestinipullorum TaxID=2840820 RepID=A0A9D1HXT7_9BACT|nr:hypothetical protein [Candidatus Fimihabitans intestinipullorum]
MKKKIGIILVACLAMFATGCGCDKKEEKVEKKEDEVKVNTSEDIVKDQVVEGLKLTNTSLSSQNGMATLVTEVSNNTGKDEYLLSFNIYIKDKDGNVIAENFGYVGEVIPNGTSRTITSSWDQELIGATAVEYSINR